MDQDAFQSVGEVLDTFAAECPDEAVIISVARTGERRNLTFSQLKVASDKVATLLWNANAGKPFLGVVELANGPEHFIWALGVWKAGGCYVPLSPRLANAERMAVYEQLNPAVVVTHQQGEGMFPAATWFQAHDYEAVIKVDDAFRQAPPAVPCKAIMTAGTTGKPKAVYQNSRIGVSKKSLAEWFTMSGQGYGQTQLLLGPLSHGAAGSSAFMGVLAHQKIVILEKFDAEQAVSLIHEFGVQATVMVPTMMRRIADVPNIDEADLSSLVALCHTGSFCPQELKRRWINLIGADHVFEIYSMSEAIGMTLIRGDEWLLHPGSVGRPYNCELEIRDSKGFSLPVGKTGEIFMRPRGSITMKSKDIECAAAKTQADGFFTVGDLGYLSEDGYLYFLDRRTDMIITGGMNVFACEVERALLASPWILEAAVIGVPDSEWGQKICAYVVLKPQVNLDEGWQPALQSFLKKHLNSYKVPKEFCVMDSLPKSDVGKILHTELRRRIAG